MTALHPREVRLLSSALVEASPDRLARVLAVIDALPDRAAADQLLTKVRPALQRLGLPRPLRFTRLLFTPLDGMIIDACKWVPQELGVPRSVLTIIAEVVKDTLGNAAAEIEAECTRYDARDTKGLIALGRNVWPAAAACLPQQPPASWKTSDLSPDYYRSIVEQCSVAWRHSLRVWPAVQAAAEGPPEELVRGALGPAIAEGELACSVVLHLVTAKARKPASVAAIALEMLPSAFSPAVRATQRAVDHCLSSSAKDVLAPKCMETDQGALEAAAAAEAACALIEDFEASVFSHRSDRRASLVALRKAAEAACIDNFDRFMSSNFAERLKQLEVAKPDNVEALVSGLERAARLARKIERGGRRLGSARHFDGSLEDAVADTMRILASCGDDGLLKRADTLRLAEILIGSDGAERLAEKMKKSSQ